MSNEQHRIINTDQIMYAELITFKYNEKGELIDHRDNLSNKTMVVICDKYIINIEKPHYEFEMYRTGMEVDTNKVYILNLFKPESIDIATHAKAQVACDQFLRRKEKENGIDKRKVLELKPKENRD